MESSYDPRIEELRWVECVLDHKERGLFVTIKGEIAIETYEYE